MSQSRKRLTYADCAIRTPDPKDRRKALSRPERDEIAVTTRTQRHVWLGAPNSAPSAPTNSAPSPAPARY